MKFLRNGLKTKNNIPWDKFELWKELIIGNLKQILKNYD